MMGRIPLVDLGPWLHGDSEDQAVVAAKVDETLRTAGFMLISGHGVPTELGTEARRLARKFFALPQELKEKYAVGVDGRGWIPPGAEANGRADGSDAPPDLKESYALHTDNPTGNREIDQEWFIPNVFPTEVPELEPVLREYMRVMQNLADELMSACAVALGLPLDYFAPYTSHPTDNLLLNWYPALTRVGTPLPGQFRIGEHTDWGPLTILDREPGIGGLQVRLDGKWEEVPFEPGAYTINIGDLMARWTGDRWRSTVHRVLPPPADAPEEDLLSLVYLHEANVEAVISPLGPPIGKVDYPPITWGAYYREAIKTIEAV
jgi:isopenicillin N synthase-like dioxygenase